MRTDRATLEKLSIVRTLHHAWDVYLRFVADDLAGCVGGGYASQVCADAQDHCAQESLIQQPPRLQGKYSQGQCKQDADMVQGEPAQDLQQDYKAHEIAPGHTHQGAQDGVHAQADRCARGEAGRYLPGL